MSANEQDLLGTVPIGLVEGLELLQGVEGLPLLHDPRRGHYVRLSRLGATLLPLLDGRYTGEELVGQLSRSGAAQHEQIRPTLFRFLNDLRAAGVLTLPPRRSLWYRLLHVSLLLRLPLPPAATRWFEALADRVARGPEWLGQRLVPLALGLSILGILHVFFNRDGLQPAAPSFPLLAIGVLIHLFWHEMAHAVLCRRYDVALREVGVGLLFGVLPVAYVDRTDAYRLDNRRAQVLIALAGPALDILGAGLSALILLGMPRSATIYGLFLAQVTFCITNLNPLLPTDGSHVLEALMGEVDLRRRAGHYVLHKLFRRPLPSALAYIGPKKRLLYLLSAGLCSTYLVVLVLLIVLRG